MICEADVLLEAVSNSRKPLRPLGKITLDVRADSLAERAVVYLVVDGQTETGRIEHADISGQAVPIVHVSLPRR